MDYQTAQHRYLHDVAFKQLCDLMLHHIMEMNYTPSEMRDAAMLASIMFEQSKPREYFVSKDDLSAVKLAAIKSKD